MTKAKINVRDLCLIGLFTAVLVVCAQITVPLGPIPFTLQTFAVVLAGTVLGRKNGTLATMVYLLLGGCGLPVFAGFKGGLAVFVGPTGGFLIGFILVAFLCGYTTRRGLGVMFPVLALLCLHALGMLWFAIGAFGVLNAESLSAAWKIDAPFIFPDIAKTALAVGLGKRIRKIVRLQEPA